MIRHDDKSEEEKFFLFFKIVEDGKEFSGKRWFVEDFLASVGDGRYEVNLTIKEDVL